MGLEDAEHQQGSTQGPDCKRIKVTDSNGNIDMQFLVKLVAIAQGRLLDLMRTQEQWKLGETQECRALFMAFGIVSVISHAVPTRSPIELTHALRNRNSDAIVSGLRKELGAGSSGHNLHVALRVLNGRQDGRRSYAL